MLYEEHIAQCWLTTFIFFSSTIFYTHNSLGIIILSFITYDQPIGFSSLSSFIYPATYVTNYSIYVGYSF